MTILYGITKTNEIKRVTQSRGVFASEGFTFKATTKHRKWWAGTMYGLTSVIELEEDRPDHPQLVALQRKAASMGGAARS